MMHTLPEAGPERSEAETVTFFPGQAPGHLPLTSNPVVLSFV